MSSATTGDEGEQAVTTRSRTRITTKGRVGRTWFTPAAYSFDVDEGVASLPPRRKSDAMSGTDTAAARGLSFVSTEPSLPTPPDLGVEAAVVWGFVFRESIHRRTVIAVLATPSTAYTQARLPDRRAPSLQPCSRHLRPRAAAGELLQRLYGRGPRLYWLGRVERRLDGHISISTTRYLAPRTT
jgi:hypothetical protein